MRPDKTAFWVRRDQKKKAYDKLLPTKERFEKYDAGCLFVAHANGQPCGKPVNNLCHTIPRRQVLTPLSNRGQVREALWGFGNFINLFMQGSEDNPVDMSDLERYQPRLIGIDEASCGRFACKTSSERDHDGVFRPIDIARPDFTDPLVAFLAQYRADLYAVYQLKRADSVMSDWAQKIMRRGLPAQRNEFIKNKDLLDRLLPFMQEKVNRLGVKWHTDGRSANTAHKVVDGQQFSFRSNLTFAACVFYGRSSVASVFPAGGDLHQMGITNLVEDTQQDAEVTKGFFELATASMQKDDYGVDMITLLSGSSSGVIVMSPDSYDKLSTAESNIINQWVHRFAQAETMARNINSMLSDRQNRQRRRRRSKKRR